MSKDLILLIIFLGLILLSASLIFSFILYKKVKKNNSCIKQLKQDIGDAKIENDYFIMEVRKRLHDDILQTSLALPLTLTFFGSDSIDAENRAKALQRASEISHQLINKAKFIHYYLSPESIGPPEIIIPQKEITYFISKAFKIICKPKAVDYHIEIEGMEQILNSDARILVVRIAIDAVNNIVRYTSTPFINILFDFKADHFVMQISDSGPGYDIEMLNKYNPAGIPNMYRRANCLNAQLNIDSQPPSGGKITLNCPYQLNT